MYVSQWRTIWDIRILLRRGTGLQQPTCLSTRYKVPYHIIKSKLIISSLCRLWDKRQDNMSIWRSPRYEEKEYHKCCHFLSYIQVSSMFRISLDYITWTYISQTGTLPKLLVCPTVCITLGLMLLKIRVRKEANMGVKVISSDIYINVNSDIYIVLV